jgi:hypothetical protein
MPTRTNSTQEVTDFMKHLHIVVLAVALVFPNLVMGQVVVTRSGSTVVPISGVMTNRDVVGMVSLGLSDDAITDKIRAATITNFDTSVNGMRALKAAKVSDAVMRAMINPPAPVPNNTAPTTAPDSGLPTEIGVYLMVKGKLTEVEPEIVGWQTGGVLKRIATVGFDHGHVNGKIMHPKSPLRVTVPVEFIIRTPEGTSATEYQFIRLYEKGNRREFRAMTGGVFHASGGAERTTVEFKPEKMAPRTWKIRLNQLDVGEYGLLPPGVSSASISSSGKMYTFGVLE